MKLRLGGRLSPCVRPELGMRGVMGLCLFALTALPFAPLSAADAPPATASGNGVGSQFELAFWQAVAESEDKAQLEAYLAQYPNGTFSALARAKIGAIDKKAGGAPVPVAAPVPAVMAAPAAPVPAPAPAAPPAPARPAAVFLPGTPVIAAPAPVAAPAAVAAPAPVPAAVPAPEPAAAPAASLSDQLRALGQSQGLRPGAAQEARAQLPARPVLHALPALDLPAQFCSAVERNSYYDSVYKPAIELADQNNQMAIAHMRKLQQAYDAAAQNRDATTANLYAAESKDYEAIAKDAYATRSSYDAVFTRFMAVPVSSCTPTGGK